MSLLTVPNLISHLMSVSVVMSNENVRRIMLTTQLIVPTLLTSEMLRILTKASG